MKCNKDTCMCDINFDDDNGYEFILDELKDIRKRVDKTISLMESRKEKDSIIDKVLNTEYEDDESIDEQKNEIDVDDIIKAIALRNILDPYNRNTTKRYISPYPDRLYTWF